MIHNAISENKKIRLQYYQWNVKKEIELHHNGALYHISPWGLSWDDANYYLIGYDSDAGQIKHYRGIRCYISNLDKRQKMELSIRRVQTLCSTDRIPGVIKIGSYWAIPVDAEKPKGERIKSGKYVKRV